MRVGHVLVESRSLHRQIGARIQRLNRQLILVHQNQHFGFIPGLKGVYRIHGVVVTIVA